MGELAAVSRIDGRTIGAGRAPGPLTARLGVAFGRLVSEQAERVVES